MNLDRLARARVALEGLSVGDAFGQTFFVDPRLALYMVEARGLSRGPWRYTDDTEMALALYAVLERHGRVDPDALAAAFAARYEADPMRGYGGTAHGILQAIAAGAPWTHAAGSVFDGMGSMGNGAAMRVAPAGAYFADDLDAVIAAAEASAAPTHAHPEGVAGAVAVALAAAYAWRCARDADFAAEHGPRGLLSFVLERTPKGETRDGIATALGLTRDATVALAASALGTGERVTSPDTVPFSLWCADRHLADYEQALWTTVEGLGDRDTTCAIVGGVVALYTGVEAIPEAWRAEREALSFEVVRNPDAPVFER